MLAQLTPRRGVCFFVEIPADHPRQALIVRLDGHLRQDLPDVLPSLLGSQRQVDADHDHAAGVLDPHGGPRIRPRVAGELHRQRSVLAADGFDA